MRKIRVAQIGNSQTTHAAPILEDLLKQSDVFEVLGVADVGDRHTGALPEVYDRVPKLTLDELWDLPDLDGVIIECDEDKQTQYALMAAERGIPIQMDKPGSESDEEYDRLLDLVEKKGIPFRVSYMYRTNPSVQYALDAVKRGELGDVYCVEGQMNTYHSASFRNAYQYYHGGIMFYLGCHMVDILYSFLGEPERVIPYNTFVGEADVKSKDFGLAIFEYQNGRSIAKVSAAEYGGAPNRRSIVICGTKGTIEIRPIEYPVGNGLNQSDVVRTYADEHQETITFGPYGRYTEMLADFAAILRGEKVFDKEQYAYERMVHKLVLKACDVSVKG